MADRIGGPSGPGSGPGSPRRGFVSRNPFLLAILAVAAMLAISTYCNNATQYELGFRDFVAHVGLVPVVTPTSGPEGATPATRPAAAAKIFGHKPLRITPTAIEGKIKLSEKF